MSPRIDYSNSRKQHGISKVLSSRDNNFDLDITHAKNGESSEIAHLAKQQASKKVISPYQPTIVQPNNKKTNQHSDRPQHDNGPEI